jgi:hypothetical protein
VLLFLGVIMKKISFFLILCLGLSFIFAQEGGSGSGEAAKSSGNDVEVVKEEHKTGEKPWDEVYFSQEKGKSPNLKAEYTLSVNYVPYSHEALMIYITNTDTFAENDYLQVVRERAALLAKEKGYFHFYYPKTPRINEKKDGTTTCAVEVVFSVGNGKPLK